MINSIKYIEHKNIDFAKWDSCIEKSQTSFVFGLRYFLDIMHPGWNAFVVNDYDSVFPITSASKYGVKYIFQPYFTQQLGLIGKHESDKEVLDFCIKEILKKFKYVECNLNYLNISLLEQKSCRQNKSYTIELSRDYDQISTLYSKNLKRNIAKSLKFDLQIVTDIEPSEIIDLFSKNKGVRLKHINKMHYQRLEEVLRELLKKEQLKIFGAKGINNELLAAAALINFRSRNTFFFSGLSKKGREFFAMPFLIDNIIRSLANQKLIFDFMGSNQPDLARFYKSFGASEYVYLRFVHNALPWPLNQLKK